MPCVRLAGNVMRAGELAGPGISLAGLRSPAGRFGTLLSTGCSSGRARLQGHWFPPRKSLVGVGSVSAPCHKWSKLGGKGPELGSAPLGAGGAPLRSPPLTLGPAPEVRAAPGLRSRVRRWLRIPCAAPASLCV